MSPPTGCPFPIHPRPRRPSREDRDPTPRPPGGPPASAGAQRDPGGLATSGVAVSSRGWMGRKLTDEELRRRATAVWAHESYSLAGKDLGLSRNGITAVAYKMGFSRALNGGGEILRGPCLGCLTPHDVETLDDDRLCPRCLRGGCADEELAHGRTLAEERALHRQRMREREQGRREPLGQPRTPITYVMRGAKVQ
jgi:hypothetical protein